MRAMSRTRLRRRAASQTERDAESRHGGTSLVLLRALALGDDERACALLRDLLGRGTSGEYSTVNLPPRTSPRTFHELCRSGAVPRASKTGRTWSCPRDAWHAARSRRPAPRLHLVQDAPTNEDLADLAIAASHGGRR